PHWRRGRRFAREHEDRPHDPLDRLDRRLRASRGSVGALFLAEGAQGDAQVLRDVCVPITAMNSLAATRNAAATAVVAKETEIRKAKMEADQKKKKKPPNILAMIIEGKLKTWFGENVLVDQIFVKDEAKSKTVGDLLKGVGLTAVKFVRYKVGELA